MKCPFCRKNDDRVIDSRAAEDGVSIRRRRECNQCKRRFTSYERVEEIPFYVVKKDGSRQAYDRQRIFKGLLKACEKRFVPVEEIEKVADKVEAAIMDQYENEVTSKEIGGVVINELKQLDQVAYVRFASVYREFKDVNEFMKELEDLLKEKSENV